MVEADALPLPSSQDALASKTAFLLGPFDYIDIRVFGNPELDIERVQIDASGRIVFPLIGNIEIAGLTPSDASRLIADGLKGKYLRNPSVSVNLKETASQTIAISGEVKRPGIYPLVGDMTLMKAIARAEGWTEFSKKREVIVFRRVDGKQYGALYDAKAIERGNYADPTIYRDDVIIVGDSQARRNLKDILTAAPPLVAPLIFLLDSNN